MKLPQFDHTRMFWDDWCAFHVVHDWHFVQFDTGEFAVIKSRWSPTERKVYENLHLQIVATDDKDCPPLFVPGVTEDGKSIPKSHLNHTGMQVLLLDHDSQRAVSLEGWMTTDNAGASLPERFVSRDCRGRNVRAYYAGPNAFPLGAVPITRHFPAPLAREQRAHIVELQNACNVWLNMQDNPAELAIKARRDTRDVQRRVDYFVDTPFCSLTTTQRLALAVRGFDMIKKEENPYLTFKTWFEYNKKEDSND